MANEMDGWIPVANRFVAVIDIMGFKDMVARSTQTQIHKMMLNVNKKIKLNATIDWEDLDKLLVSTTSYSDSIMLYTKDSDIKSLKALVYTISGITNDLLSDCIPHKGAMAFGEMTLDKDNAIYFGQPLIDAFLLQEEIKFYGIVLHASAELELNNTSLLRDGVFLKNYKCSFKQGESWHITIPPMYAMVKGEKFSAKKLKLYNSIQGLRFKTSGHLRVYVDNTEKYLQSFEMPDKQSQKI